MGPDQTVILGPVGVDTARNVALQILKATTAARIIALDSNEEKLAVARAAGADLALPSHATARQRILDETDGYGADVVLDFVGAQPTIELATKVIAPEGILQFVGLGGGRFTFAADLDGEALPWGVTVQRAYGGTRVDLLQVITLVQQGKVHLDTVLYPLDEFQRAFDDLTAGKVTGRAILVL